MKVNYKKLITLIGGKCWSVRDLVKEANIQPKAYYDIKAGKDTLNIKTVGKIAKALDVSVDEILIID
ncbi:helix-turn-helix transcriptional regulator [Fusobacterium nucleatum]|uniref:helix-turn-helix domain-containing protein n=1 Tax=Fusobacterium nucleatum TaxID=851 RepID=UPI0030D0B850